LIVVLVIFGLVCIIGAFLVCFFYSAVTGSVLGILVHAGKKAEEVIGINVVQAPQKFFIKLGGGQRVQINEDEVKAMQKQGYEILIE
jgi:hypothetical protein